MRRSVAVLGLLLVSGTLQASDLDEAVNLVLSAHPVVEAAELQFAEINRKSAWSMNVNVGWSERGTIEGGAAGANAGVQVNIPLFDRSHQREVARERIQLQTQRQQVHAGFLEAVRSLRADAAALESASTQKAFAKDRLVYGRKQVDEGIESPDTLWPLADSLHRAELDYASKKDALAIHLDTVSRRYGGDQWRILRDRLDAHLKSKVP